MNNIDLAMECGWSKPIANLELTSREELKKVICVHHILLKCKAEMDQLREGLVALGVMEIMVNNPSCLQDFFVFTEEGALTAGMW